MSMDETVQTHAELFQRIDDSYEYQKTKIVKGVEFIVMDDAGENIYFLYTIDEDIYTTELVEVRSDSHSNTSSDLVVAERRDSNEKVMLDDDGIHNYTEYLEDK